MGYEDVQADYIDDIITEITEQLLLSGLLDELEVVQFQADIKAAFKMVMISINSIGSICIEFDGWLFVYGRTAFGWKWATHTWSVFAKAIKAKVRSHERNGWGARNIARDWTRMGNPLPVRDYFELMGI